ncbi:EamA family transporter [Kribbella qitaiheensis]|uniref:EamA family transporter n=1 Tax=Kribbella qitaiheensis TaxID=1544730 RepID=A0A7G6X4I0_9ACTN|nr:EamA family transporter [Kribbella qitaiheensis]QNE21145.1 EamA family transporter [Kribbella qitaiheensis]
MRAPRVPPTAMVLGGVVSVQFGGALAAQLIEKLGAVGTVSLRLALAVPILLVIARPGLKQRTKRDFLAVVAFGIVLGLMNLSFYLSLERLPLGVAVTIEFIGPLGLAAAMSRKRRDLIAVAGAALGVVLVNGHELSAVNWLGVAFAGLAGVLWACYILLSAETGRRFAQLDGLALAIVVSALITTPFGFASAGSELLHWHSLVAGLAIAVLSSVLPYSLETLALRRMKPAVFGILMSLEPAVGATAGFLILSQRLAVIQLAGMACVVAASIAITRTPASEAPDI